MGCDIHLFKEIKINGEWQYFGEADIQPNYHLFAYLANVRNYDNINSIAANRGIPMDISVITQCHLERWQYDGHSHSFLKADEMEFLENFLNIQNKNSRRHYCPEDTLGTLFGSPWSNFWKYPNKRKYDIEDVRFIFWFDN